MTDVKKGYKAFEPGLVCRGKQYSENTTFEEKGGAICKAGMMHYCTNPLDCLDYYPLVRDDGQISAFAEVTAEAEPVTDDGKKYATKKIHVGAKLTLKGYIDAAFSFLWERSGYKETIKKADNSAKLAASGDYVKLAASGDYAQLAASGKDSIVAGIGIGNTAKAALGCWICLAEWVYSAEKEAYIPVCVKAAQIDGEALKADTYYALKNGEFVEVEK